jgi:hypothetical protein
MRFKTRWATGDGLPCLRRRSKGPPEPEVVADPDSSPGIDVVNVSAKNIGDSELGIYARELN